MKTASTTVLLAIIVLILISCDEDSGTNEPGGTNTTDYRIKSVIIDEDETAVLNFNKAEYEYDDDGSLDEIHLYLVEKWAGYKYIVTPEYEGADTNYAFTYIKNIGDTLPNPINYVTVRWDGDTRHTEYFYDTHINGLDTNNRLLDMVTVYDNGRIIGNNIITRIPQSTSTMMHEYKYTHGDSVVVDYTRTRVGAEGYQTREIYTMHLTDKQNPLDLLSLLAVYNWYDRDMTLHSTNLIEGFNEDFTYIDYDTGNEEIWPRPRRDYVYEYSAEGNLVRMSGPFVADHNAFVIEIEWEEVD